MSTLKQCSQQPLGYPRRADVCDIADWNDPKYAPIEFTAPFIAQEPHPVWADPTTVSLRELNARITYSDGHIKPLSEACAFDNTTHRFLNPFGKTGISGRGALGKWGPNHAADVLVTWESNAKCMVLLVSKHVGDSCNLAFPAGMVEPGKTVPATLYAELTEEAVKESNVVHRLFKECEVGIVYRGVVDDFRNTDHAWLETTAMHFHATPEIGEQLQLSITDTNEIKGVAWYDITEVTEMYASHIEWLTKLKTWWRSDLRRLTPCSE